MRNYVVTGTGRSGTKFTAKLFTQLGWKCGHEDVFTSSGQAFEGFDPYIGDSSWLAVPHLGHLPRDTVVLHQVREPLSTIRSLASRRILLDWHHPEVVAAAVRYIARRQPPRGPFHAVVKRHNPEALKEPSALQRAARHWVDWNKAAERAADTHDYLRYRLEDLDVTLIRKIAELLQADIPDHVVLPAETTNSRVRRFEAKGLEHLPSALQRLVVEAAARYGYELDVVDPASL